MVRRHAGRHRHPSQRGARRSADRGGVQRRDHPGSAAGAPASSRQRRPPLQSFSKFVSHDQWGADHFGFRVAGDLQAFCDAIRLKGGAFAVEPYEFAPGTRIAYLAGPDGVSIELVEAKAD